VIGTEHRDGFLLEHGPDAQNRGPLPYTEGIGGASSARFAARTSAQGLEERRDPGLVGHVEAAVNRCRQSRKAVSVLAIGIDNEANLAFTTGVEGVRRAVQLVITVARSLCEGDTACIPVGEGRAAVVLEDYDRSQAVTLARRLTATVAQCVTARQAWFGGMTLSVGVATLALSPRNFPPQELIDAAWRCLSAAQTSGGNVVKSIDIY
ncbi:MAG: hypothetical protein KY475_01635, partial [Planctomycetes bacterium]|nr:hypothetical protein [Planctomycetota bacterium]